MKISYLKAIIAAAFVGTGFILGSCLGFPADSLGLSSLFGLFLIF